MSRTTHILCLMIGVVLLGCGSDRVGVLTVEAGDQTVYFIRTTRGLNFDELVLSPSSNVCQEMRAPTNLVFLAQGPSEPFYRWDGRALHIYSQTDTQEPASFPVPLIVHNVSPPAYQDFTRSQNRTLHRAEVPAKLSFPCEAFWF